MFIIILISISLWGVQETRDQLLQRLSCLSVYQMPNKGPSFE